MRLQLMKKLKKILSNVKSRIFDLNEFDATIITLMNVLLVIGVFLFYINYNAYKDYVAEDGIIEWLTVIALFISADISIKRFFKLRSKRDFRFLATLVFIALLFLFGAGEEISWGQRIFNIVSPDFFLQHNAQHETNIHNLIFLNIKINKLVFSFLIGVIIVLYFTLITFLYHNNQILKSFIDNHGIPIPRIGHIISLLIFIIIIELFPEHGDKWELLEMGASFIFSLIIVHPLNEEIYNSNSILSLSHRNTGIINSDKL